LTVFDEAERTAVKRFVQTLSFVVYGVATVSALWPRSLLLTAVLVLGSIVMLALQRDAEEYVLYGVAAVTGAIAEVVAIYYGAWQYTAPDVAGIPYWLPVLWGMAAIAMKRMTEVVHTVFIHEQRE
jgi:hypothetical protein